MFFENTYDQLFCGSIHNKVKFIR